jgi:hypothetical protein
VSATGPRTVVIVQRVPWWGVISSAGSPALLVSGSTVAARLQPRPFNPVADTISSLAAVGAADRWVMTWALAGVGACYVVTGLALRPAARTAPGRCGRRHCGDARPARVVRRGADLGRTPDWPSRAGAGRNTGATAPGRGPDLRRERQRASDCYQLERSRLRVMRVNRSRCGSGEGDGIGTSNSFIQAVVLDSFTSTGTSQ